MCSDDLWIEKRKNLLNSCEEETLLAIKVNPENETISIGRDEFQFEELDDETFFIISDLFRKHSG